MRRFDLRSLHFDRDEHVWRRLPVDVDPFVLGGAEYVVEEGVVNVLLDVSRVGDRLTLSLSFAAVLHGPCARCLEDAHLEVRAADADYAVGGQSEDVGSAEAPYVFGWSVDIGRWVRDVLGAALPMRILCQDDCQGLCPICGANLNRVEPGHSRDVESEHGR